MNTATLVDGAAPITFRELASRFRKYDMTGEKYQRTFRLPLSFADITNPDLGREIVGYRSL
jgi:hypothetical protein